MFVGLLLDQDSMRGTEMQVLDQCNSRHCNWKLKTYPPPRPHPPPTLPYLSVLKNEKKSPSRCHHFLWEDVYMDLLSGFLCVLFLLSWTEGLFGKHVFISLSLPPSKSPTVCSTPLPSKLSTIKNEVRGITSKKDKEELLQGDSL